MKGKMTYCYIPVEVLIVPFLLELKSMRTLSVLFGLTTLVCVLSYEMSTQLSFSAPFKQFTYSGIG